MSAHWVEEEAFKLTSTDKQFLHFDYFGFSPDAYDVNYSPPGDPKFARKVGCPRTGCPRVFLRHLSTLYVCS